MKALRRIPKPDDDKLARQLSALSHPARLAILRSLACRDHCPCKDVVAALPLAQSTVSQHLKVLADAGLVDAEFKRPRTLYRLNRPALAKLGQALTDFAESCCVVEAPRAEGVKEETARHV